MPTSTPSWPPEDLRVLDFYIRTAADYFNRGMREHEDKRRQEGIDLMLRDPGVREWVRKRLGAMVL